MGRKTLLDIFRWEHLPGSTVAIIYDAYSSAWRVPFYLLRYGIEQGYFGVVSNYSTPLRGFFRKAKATGLDLKAALERGDLGIIDLFGSRYRTREDLPGVFYLDKVEPETLNPKIELIYSGPLGRFMSTRNVIRLVYTLDGAALMLGEDNTLKLLNQTIASKSLQLPDSTLILPLNQDVVSRRFVAWVTGISDYVVLTRSTLEIGGLREILYVLSAPYEDFEPAAYALKVTKAGGIEKLRIRKISP